MAIVSPYTSIITWNAHRLNSPLRRHRVDEYVEKKIRQYVAYKRLNLTLRIRIGWEWRDRKRYSILK